MPNVARDTGLGRRQMICPVCSRTTWIDTYQRGTSCHGPAEAFHAGTRMVPLRTVEQYHAAIQALRIRQERARSPEAKWSLDERRILLERECDERCPR